MKKTTTTIVEGAPEFQGTCMTGSSESHQEATALTMDTLNTAKTKLKIGFWNVQTLYDTGED